MRTIEVLQTCFGDTNFKRLDTIKRNIIQTTLNRQKNNYTSMTSE
jgi:hypothetical protein